MNEPVEPKFQLGDFARNTIHGHISFLYKRDSNTPIYFDGLVIDVSKITDEWPKGYRQVGMVRVEVDGELEKVEPTLPLITWAKGFLNNLNLQQYQQLDNLSYIELLYKLNEQEKALKNENPV